SNRNTKPTQPARSTQSNRNTKPTHPAQPARSTQSTHSAKTIQPANHPTQPARSTQSTHSAKTIQPAKALKSTPSAPPKPQPSHPPIRPWRLISLVLATAMLLFCIIIGGKMVSDLAGNERQMLAVRQDYLERKGVALDSDAMRVELPPPGVTFEPTQAPALVETPSPEPVFIINDAAAVSLNHRDTSNVSEPAPITPTPNPRTKQFSYPDNPLLNIMASIQAAHAENADVVGHVVIDGLLDEAVVMRNNTYYLNHSAQGSPSESGAVFIDESCALRFPPENLLLRGQSAIAGKVFAPLWRFKEDGSAFVASATTLKLTTLYEETHFVLFAVIVAGSTPGLSDYFNFASHPSFASDQSMLDYVQSAKEHSLYQFKVDVDATDRLLTLATLGNSTSNQSLVLLYRMLRPGEAPR
ncbi:MAG: class B sortase, partial [Clostridia bacterium]